MFRETRLCWVNTIGVENTKTLFRPWTQKGHATTHPCGRAIGHLFKFFEEKLMWDIKSYSIDEASFFLSGGPGSPGMTGCCQLMCFLKAGWGLWEVSWRGLLPGIGWGPDLSCSYFSLLDQLYLLKHIVWSKGQPPWDGLVIWIRVLIQYKVFPSKRNSIINMKLSYLHNGSP